MNDRVVQSLVVNREILSLGPGVLAALAERLRAAGIVHKLLEESRLGGKATAIGVAPLPKQALTELLGGLPLLR